MSSDDSLPVILVSAADVGAAAQFITELTETAGAEGEGPRVWQLANKYYRAAVRLWPRADLDAGSLLPAPHAVEAHVVYLAQDECDAETLCARVEASRAATAARCSVRLAAAECAEAPPALEAAARAARYELVPLREAPPPDSDTEVTEEEEEGPFPEVYGVQRARATLHAHAWSGLQRVDRRAAGVAAQGASGAAGSEEDEEEAAVQRAEQFVEALAALPDARAAACAARGEREGEEGAGARLARAEALVAAFCRALGHDLDDW